jgi:hypothetical protein
LINRLPAIAFLGKHMVDNRVCVVEKHGDEAQ